MILAIVGLILISAVLSPNLIWGLSVLIHSVIFTFTVVHAFLVGTVLRTFKKETLK